MARQETAALRRGWTTGACAAAAARAAFAALLTGDYPDVTHGALIVAELAWASPGSGIHFHAGEGVGTVTRPGLALAVGEPAINPAPRAMIRETLADLAEANGAPSPDLAVTIAIPGGERLAERTM